MGRSFRSTTIRFPVRSFRDRPLRQPKKEKPQYFCQGCGRRVLTPGGYCYNCIETE